MPVHDAGEIHAGSWEEKTLKSCNNWLKHDAYNTAKNKGFWRYLDLVQPPIILQNQTSKSSTQNIKMRHIVLVQQGNKGTLITRVVIVSGCRDMLQP
jgi:hypothetical protein